MSNFIVVGYDNVMGIVNNGGINLLWVIGNDINKGSGVDYDDIMCCFYGDYVMDNV